MRWTPPRYMLQETNAFTPVTTCTVHKPGLPALDCAAATYGAALHLEACSIGTMIWTGKTGTAHT